MTYPVEFFSSFCAVRQGDRQTSLNDCFFSKADVRRKLFKTMFEVADADIIRNYCKISSGLSHSGTKQIKLCPRGAHIPARDRFRDLGIYPVTLKSENEVARLLHSKQLSANNV